MTEQYPTYKFDYDKIKEYYSKQLQTNRERLEYLYFIENEFDNQDIIELSPGYEMLIDEHEEKILESKGSVKKKKSLPVKLANDIKHIKQLIDLEGEISQETTKEKKQLADTKEKFRWDGTKTQLIYLIDQLFKVGLLKKAQINRKDQLINSHFADTDGIDFKNLPQSRCNLSLNDGQKPRGYEDVDDIICQTKTK